jgi:hypothetical protein
MKSRLGFISVGSLCIVMLCTPATSRIFPGSPNCPWNEPSHNWKDYLLGKYGDTISPFTVRFDHLKVRLGNITPNGQAGVHRTRDGHWVAAMRGYGGNGVGTYTGGDPNKLEINVGGQILTFNKGGEVYHPTLGLVGTLVCLMGK